MKRQVLKRLNNNNDHKDLQCGGGGGSTGNAEDEGKEDVQGIRLGTPTQIQTRAPSSLLSGANYLLPKIQRTTTTTTRKSTRRSHKNSRIVFERERMVKLVQAREREMCNRGKHQRTHPFHSFTISAFEHASRQRVTSTLAASPGRERPSN